jgi:phosphatidylglycerophosphatase C
VKKSIAFFDFDGTITTSDTLLEFIKYSKGRMNFYLGFALNSPYLVAYKLKIITNQKAKEKVLRYFFGKMPVAEFQQHCDAFAKDIIPGLIRPKALEELKKLRESGTQLVIVSASPENWIRNWADSIGASLIATKLQVDKQCLSGLIDGNNCYGEEKVKRILQNYQLEDYSEILAYGDSSGDRPMLALASTGHYKPFRS